MNIPWHIITPFFVLAIQVYNDRIRREKETKDRIEEYAAGWGSRATRFEDLLKAIRGFLKEDPNRWGGLKPLIHDLDKMQWQGRVLTFIFGTAFVGIIYFSLKTP